MRLDNGQAPCTARVEMVPLIDTIFLLLAFFVFAMLSMVVQRGLPVTLPAVEGGQPDAREAIVITIRSDEQLFVDGEPTSLGTLSERVRPRIAESPEKPIWIRGDRSASLGLSLAVLGSLREAGASQVSFQTQDPVP